MSFLIHWWRSYSSDSRCGAAGTKVGWRGSRSGTGGEAATTVQVDVVVLLQSRRPQDRGVVSVRPISAVSSRPLEPDPILHAAHKMKGAIRQSFCNPFQYTLHPPLYLTLLSVVSYFLTQSHTRQRSTVLGREPCAQNERKRERNTHNTDLL
ncbi:hypothetical protein BaRGS_00037949 [Batillaria attramentaria]|uniref:Uncharacterized protein n=1 Tax=Batillaria attramentaria TaxID=370345 RepID=A0ABD0J7F1_9CAEN